MKLIVFALRIPLKIPLRINSYANLLMIKMKNEYSLCPRCTRFIHGYICGGLACVFDADFEFLVVFELELLASLLSLLDVLEAGLEMF